MSNTAEILDTFLDAIAERVADRLAKRAAAPAGDFVSEDELVALLGSKEKVKKLIKSGALDGSVVGHRIVAKRSALAAFLETRRPRPRKVEPAPKAENDELDLDALAAAGGMRPTRRRS